jgi:hypothetical protein
MKLNELGAQRQTKTIAKVFESHLGKNLDLSTLGTTQAQHMLRRVRSLVKEHRTTTGFHTSERNPSYLTLVMMEQALSSHIKEAGEVGAFGTTGTTGTPGQPNAATKAAMMKDPKLQATLKKATAGTSLTKDEQQKLAGVAMMTKESRRGRVMESELQQAQVVLAGQDMVDQIQKMIEQISEMQFKDLPALVATIKNDMGTEQANQYQTQSTEALNSLLQAVQQGKTQLDAAQATLSGEAPAAMPGNDLGLDGFDGADADLDAVDADDLSGDLDLDANLDNEKPSAALGRDRR